MDNNPQQPKGHKETGPKEDTTEQPYNQQRDLEQRYNQQDDQWQAQRKRNNNSQQAPRGNTRQTEHSTKQAGIITIPTQNTYINLDVQVSPDTLETMDKHTGSKSDSRPQIALKQQQEQALFKGKEVITGHNDTGIDSILPSPEPLDNVVNVENVVEEAVGGMAGRIHETPTNVQEGVPKREGGIASYCT
uniref:Uncharacterized protein n=1 Tax=Solanum tuberosum TaxID=4113 RepID=M1DCV2_SOLTU